MAAKVKLQSTDRVQISLSNGYDPKIISQWLMLCPIEALVTESELNSFELIITAPPGIVVNCLPSEDASKYYYVNIDDEIYSRLQMPRHAGMVIRFTINTALEDYVLLKDEPIVIKPFKEDMMIIGATKVWGISRAKRSDKLLPVDPCVVPEPLIELSKIIDEQVPNELQDVIFFKRRLTNTLDVFKWYGKRYLANEVIEYLAFTSAKINNKLLECSAKEAASKVIPEWNSTALKSLISQMKHHLPDNVVKELVTRSYDEADRVTGKNKVSASEVVVENGQFDLLAYITKFADHKVYPRLRSVLSVIDEHDIPLHPCKFCLSESKYVLGQRFDASGTAVDIWYTMCTSCRSKLKRDKWSSQKSNVGMIWNKDNTGEYPVQNAPGFDFSGMEIKDISSELKSFNSLLAKVSIDARGFYKDDPKVSGELAETKLVNALSWSGYIAHQIKQINIASHQKRKNP